MSLPAYYILIYSSGSVRLIYFIHVFLYCLQSQIAIVRALLVRRETLAAVLVKPEVFYFTHTKARRQ